MRNCLRIGTRDSYKIWFPLTGSDHAMSLAVKLGICIVFFEEQGKVAAEQSRYGVIAFESLDVAGTRHAIVRAAAEIGRSMP
jgi:CRISPR/Cas system-associated endonuclease Cas1